MTIPTTNLRIAEESVELDEKEIDAEFVKFLTDVSLERHKEGPILRFNQGRAAGCVRAQFTVLAQLRPNIASAFRNPHLRRWIRFDNALGERPERMPGNVRRVYGFLERITPVSRADRAQQHRSGGGESRI